MYRIIDGRGTGKTSRLLLLAKEKGGIVICARPDTMREKAYNYGLTGIDFMSYNDFIKNIKTKNIIVPLFQSDGSMVEKMIDVTGAFMEKPIFVDNLEDLFNKLCISNFFGYTINNED